MDVVTLENEFIDSQLLIDAANQSSTPLLPDPTRFSLIEDKLSEKEYFKNLGIDVAEFYEVKSENDISEAIGYLKLSKGGYDGIGTYRVNNKDEAIETYKTIKSSGKVLFEKAVDYQKELSLIAVSNINEVVFYPMVLTHQEDGICKYVNFPADITKEIEQQAQSKVRLIMEALNTCGLFAFEFFLTNDNQLILNESAPRPHNSGHITLDLTDCSQFENHMRAISGLELIRPKILQDSMTSINLLGTRNGESNEEKIINDVNDSNTSIKLYKKKQSRIKRKMGHINLWGPNQRRRADNLIQKLEV